MRRLIHINIYGMKSQNSWSCDNFYMHVKGFWIYVFHNNIFWTTCICKCMSVSFWGEIGLLIIKEGISWSSISKTSCKPNFFHFFCLDLVFHAIHFSNVFKKVIWPIWRSNVWDVEMHSIIKAKMRGMALCCGLCAFSDNIPINLCNS
jgi:hypothetical protein